MANWLRNTAIGLVGFSLLSPAAAVALLHTQMGEQLVERQVQALSLGRMRLTELDVHNFLDVRIGSFSIGPEDESAAREIEARGIELAWSPLSLLRREARVEHLVADYIFVGQPEPQGDFEPESTEDDAAFALPTLPNLPIAIAVEKVGIDKLVFAASALGLQADYSLEGAAKISRTLGHVEADLRLVRQDREGGLVLDVRYGTPVGEINIDLTFHDEDGAPLAALTGYDGGALSIDVMAQGPLERTTLVADAKFGTGPSAQAKLDIGYDENLTLQGRLSLAPAGLGGPDLADYLGTGIPLDLDLSVAEDGNVQIAVDAHLQAPKLNAAIAFSAGGAPSQSLQYDLNIRDFTLVDLPAELGPLRFRAQGHLDQLAGIAVVDRAVLDGVGLRGTLKGALPFAVPMAARADVAIDVEELAALVPGQAGSIQANFAVRGSQASQEISITGESAAKLFLEDTTALNMTVNLAGTVNGDAAVDLQSSVLVPMLSPVNPALSGSLSVEGSLKGVIGALVAEMQLHTDRLKLEGSPLSGVLAKLQAQQAADSVAGAFDIQMIAGSQTLNVATPFAFKGGSLSLNTLTMVGPGLKGQGRLTYETANGAGEGGLDLQLLDLTPLAQIFGQQTSGAGTVSFALAGEGAKLTAMLSNVGGETLGGQIGSLAVGLSTSLSDPLAHANGSVVLKNVALGGLVSEHTELRIAPTEIGTGFDISASTTAPILAKVRTKGRIDLSRDTQLLLDGLDGEVEGEQITLVSPTIFTMNEEGGFTLHKTEIGVGDGVLSASFRMDAASVDGMLTINKLDLTQQVAAGVPLILDGGVEITGAAQNPHVSFDVAGSINIADIGEDIQIDLVGNVVDGELNSRLKVGGDGGNLQAQANAGVDLNLSEGVLGLRQDQPATVQTQGGLALAPFAFLLFDDGSTLTGTLSLTSQGRFHQGAITLDGALCLAHLSVGLVMSGTQLEGGKGCIALDRAGGLMGDLQVRDGHGGALIAKLRAGAGTVSFNDKDDRDIPKVSGDIVLNRLRVLDGDIGVMTLDGTLVGNTLLDEALTGRVSGTLTVTDADIAIPGNPGPSFETLDVSHVGRGTDQNDEPVPTADNPALGSALALNVVVDVPKQFFVRGRGIESEWKGKVDVNGTLVAPVISGDISMVKGQATTGAAVLAFSKGKVTLVPSPPSPLPIMLLDMVSESRVEGTLARMSLSGPVTKPKIEFTSEPALPEDEILARLLFGKPAAQMTASEALSLASAALELSGAFGGGTGLVGQVRRALGVDRLSVDSSSVSAGKYITPDVYLSVTQSADGSAPDIAVEYEVTDQITLTGEQEGAEGEAVGIRYEYDY